MTFPSSPTCPIVHWTASHTCQAEPRPTSNDPPPSHGRCCESPSAGGLTWQVGHARSQLAGHNESAPESTHAPWRRSRYTSWRRVRVTCQLSDCSCGTTGTATIRCPTHSSGSFYQTPRKGPSTGWRITLLLGQRGSTCISSPSHLPKLRLSVLPSLITWWTSEQFAAVYQPMSI